MKVLVLLMVGMLATSMAFAQTNIPSPGILPDSPLWRLDLFIDDVRMFFGGTEVKLEVAQKRLAEAQVMAERGKLDLAIEALDKSQILFVKFADEFETQPVDVQLRLSARLDVALQQLEELSEILPEASQQGITTAIENVERGQQSVPSIPFTGKGGNVLPTG